MHSLQWISLAHVLFHGSSHHFLLATLMKVTTMLFSSKTLFKITTMCQRITWKVWIQAWLKQSPAIVIDLWVLSYHSLLVALWQGEYSFFPFDFELTHVIHSNQWGVGISGLERYLHFCHFHKNISEWDIWNWLDWTRSQKPFPAQPSPNLSNSNPSTDLWKWKSMICSFKQHKIIVAWFVISSNTKLLWLEQRVYCLWEAYRLT